MVAFSQPSTALVAFDRSNPVSEAMLAFPDASFRAIVQSLLCISFEAEVPESAMTEVTVAGQQLFQVNRKYADKRWEGFRRFGQIVVSAALGYAAYKKGNIPHGYPKTFQAIESAFPKDKVPGAVPRSEFPHLAFANPTFNPLYGLLARSRDGVQEIFTFLNAVMVQWAQWVQRRVEVSIRKERGSRTNWGAVLGWSRQETLRRFAPYNPREPEFRNDAQELKDSELITESEEDFSIFKKLASLDKVTRN